MTDLLQSVHDIALRIVGMAMWLAPVGVACLMFGVASRFGFDVVRLLGWFVAVVTAALLLHVFGVLLPAAWITTSLAPMVFLSRCRTALVTAFSTSSSGATLPTAIDVAERQLGIPAAIAGFVLPLGSVLCMNGTALFQAVTVITLAQALGVPLNAAQMVALVAVCSVTSVAATGVPGGAIPTLIAVLMMFGLPGEAIALVLGVDRLIDMLRTTVNVAGTLVITAIIARHDGIWNVAMVPQVERGRLAHA
ncbi:MAG: cation:dicarboxylase symporter family transporter, partial [Gemmatimonadaceae bacterium]